MVLFQIPKENKERAFNEDSKPPTHTHKKKKLVKILKPRRENQVICHHL
jgi:hypothetical protein